MISTLIALTVRIVTNPLTNVFQKKLTNNGVSSLYVNLLTYCLLSILCIIPALNIHWSGYGASLWGWAAVSGCFGAAGNGCLIKALQSGELSVLGPVNSYKSIVAMITGFFFLKEIPDFCGILGVVLIIWGSYFVFETQKEGFSFDLLKRKDIQFRILATIFTAIEAVFIKKVILLSSTAAAFVLWCWFGFLFALILTVILKPESMTSYSLKTVQYLIYTALCAGLMQLSTNYVFDRMNVGYALTLFQLSLILSVVFGFVFFKEKNIIKKLAGTFVMLAGSVLIITG